MFSYQFEPFVLLHCFKVAFTPRRITRRKMVVYLLKKIIFSGPMAKPFAQYDLCECTFKLWTNNLKKVMLKYLTFLTSGWTTPAKASSRWWTCRPHQPREHLLYERGPPVPLKRSGLDWVLFALSNFGKNGIIKNWARIG